MAVGSAVRKRLARNFSRDPANNASGRGEDNFRDLLADISDVIYAADAQGLLTYVSPSVSVPLGFHPSEMIGHHLSEYLFPEDSKLVAQRFWELQSNRLEPTEFRLVAKSGEVCWVRISGKPVVSDGELVGVRGVITNVTERRQAQEALQECENRYRSLFANMLEGFAYCRMIFDDKRCPSDFVYLDVNHAFERLTGLKNVIDKPVTEIIPGIRVSHPELFETYGRVALTGVPEKLEFYFKPLNMWLSISVYSPQEGSFVAVFDDITERKQAAQLQNAVYRISQAVDDTRSLDDLYRAVHEIIQSVMPADNFYISLCDRKKSELAFPYFADERDTVSETRPFGTGMTEYVIRIGQPLLCTESIRRELIEKGEAEFVGEKPAVWLGIPLKIEQETIGVMAVQHYTEPTAYGTKELKMLEYVSAQVAKAIEKKRSEEALRESERKYRSIIENSLEGMYVIQNYVVRFCNRKFAEMFGYESPQAVIGRHIRDMTSPDTWDMVNREVQARESGGKSVSHYDFVARRKDGTEFEVEVLGSLISYQGKPAIQGCMRDISEQRQLEEQLRHAQKMEAVGRLAGGVAHDFNNLLMAIMGHADVAQMSLDANDPLSNDLTEIQNAAKRAADLTGQLLAFSRKQRLQPKILDLNIIIIKMEKMLRRIIGENIEFATVTGCDLWNVKVDPGQFEQVLANLMVNANDAMPKGGKLTIETKNVRVNGDYAQVQPGMTEGDYVMMKVVDTGIGMPEIVKARIFEPFFTTKEPGRGTGLGLSMVFGIVSQSGGYITVDSKVGAGSTFRIFLPRVVGETEAFTEIARPSEMPTGSENILIVEDEAAVRALTVRTLKKLGYRVFDAQDGGEAFVMCQKLDPPVDLIITDLIMPGVSGAEAVSRIRKLLPNVKVLYMSGYSPDTALKDGGLDPSIPFLRKPFHLFELAQKVREVLDK